MKENTLIFVVANVTLGCYWSLELT